MKKLLFAVLFFSIAMIHCGSEPGQKAFAQSEGDVQGSIKDESIVGASNGVGIDAGFASNHTIIQLPSGFTFAQCKFTAAVATIDGQATSVYASINKNTGEVICEKVIQERPEIPPQTKDCVASYTVICTK